DGARRADQRSVARVAQLETTSLVLGDGADGTAVRAEEERAVGTEGREVEQRLLPGKAQHGLKGRADRVVGEAGRRGASEHRGAGDRDGLDEAAFARQLPIEIVRSIGTAVIGGVALRRSPIEVPQVDAPVDPTSRDAEGEPALRRADATREIVELDRHVLV